MDLDLILQTVEFIHQTRDKLSYLEDTDILTLMEGLSYVVTVHESMLGATSKSHINDILSLVYCEEESFEQDNTLSMEKLESLLGV